MSGGLKPSMILAMTSCWTEVKGGAAAPRRRRSSPLRTVVQPVDDDSSIGGARRPEEVGQEPAPAHGAPHVGVECVLRAHRLALPFPGDANSCVLTVWPAAVLVTRTWHCVQRFA